jgi:hypothetical protein
VIGLERHAADASGFAPASFNARRTRETVLRRLQVNALIEHCDLDRPTAQTAGRIVAKEPRKGRGSEMAAATEAPDWGLALQHAGEGRILQGLPVVDGRVARDQAEPLALQPGGPA